MGLPFITAIRELNISVEFELSSSASAFFFICFTYFQGPLQILVIERVAMAESAAPLASPQTITPTFYLYRVLHQTN